MLVDVKIDVTTPTFTAGFVKRLPPHGDTLMQLHPYGETPMRLQQCTPVRRYAYAVTAMHTHTAIRPDGYGWAGWDGIWFHFIYLYLCIDICVYIASPFPSSVQAINTIHLYLPSLPFTLPRSLSTSWAWAIVTPTALATDRPVLHPYWPRWNPIIDSQWALASIATTSTILPRQLRSEMQR